MHRDPTFRGRSLGFSSDLSIAAPLRRGLVPALDAVTYKTRAQRLLDTLHLGRMRNHEHAYARLFSDAVERVAVIQSVRVALLEPEDKLLLTVSFDGNWDAYIRTLWVKVGGLLDVIFCNTEGYVQARLHSCEAWGEWVRRHQVQTHFFYGSSDGSATDLLYLRREERLRQDREAGAPEPPPGLLPRAEQRAREMLEMTDATIADDQWPRNELMVAAMLRQGLQSLAGLYRLADWYVPGTPDGDVLHRAAHELLQDFTRAWDHGLFRLALGNEATRLGERFARQIAWYFDSPPAPRRRQGGGDTLDDLDRADVQGGIVQGYTGISHGALLMFALDDAAAGARLLRLLLPQLNADRDEVAVKPGGFRRTLFVSLAGLRRLGLDDAAVATLPEAFVQGMAARAGLLGDRHDNHPERWTPPRRHDKPAERIDLAAVHLVVYVRVHGGDDTLDVWSLEDTRHPLGAEIERLAALEPGARLLAVEPLRRLYDPQPPGSGPHPRNLVREHFGYADGNGQPGVGRGTARPDYPGNNLPFGEFLLGHPAQGEVLPVPGVTPAPETLPPAWLRNSSFLAVRKYRQWPERFQAAIARAAKEQGIDGPLVAAKLMGRDQEGRPLVRPKLHTNEFTYLADPTGRHCPLHAHVRRANPRRLAHEMLPGEREPRILRRSLSYGPQLGESSDPDAERGLMFMAFNADIAEQFEVVQRWLAGGHATDTTSGIGCPIVGVPEPGRPRRYEFEHEGRLVRITLDGEGTLLGDARPLVRLEWGAYWLAPSLSAIGHLATLAAAAGARPPLPFSAERGRALRAALPERGATAQADWKVVLEDAESTASFDAASLWAAVRRDEGGAMKCPLGVLVGSRVAVGEVLRDSARHTTVAGYAERMRDAMGPIFLGLDDRPGSAYRDEALPVREAIERLRPDTAFRLAHEAVRARLEALVDSAKAQSAMSGDPAYELVVDPRELIDELLARLCEAWFGLAAPEKGAFFARGGFDWQASRGLPRYPGHFMAPSRYIFQPLPDAEVKATGERHAREMTVAMRRFLEAHEGRPLVDPRTRRPAPVGRAVQAHRLSRGDPGFAARTMVGAIMGFVPTMDGALRAVLAEWRRTGEFARLRGLAAGATWRLAQASTAMETAMFRALQLRPVPDVVWRRASADFHLPNGLRVEAGQVLVLGLGSAAQESLEQGRLDESRAMFGGVRDARGVPTHACPGYEAARGAMLGALAAMVTSPLPLQEMPGTPSWRIGGDSGFKPPAPAPGTGSGSGTRRGPPARGEPPQQGPRILCWGDSWVDYRAGLIGPRIDLLKTLSDAPYHYRMEGRGSFASYANWGTIAEMAAGLPRFLLELQARIDLDDLPDMILLSGGGNDSTGTALEPLLLPYKKNGPYLTPAAQDHVDALIGHYRTVLTGVAATFQAAGRPPLPVLMHGYDHPHPAWGVSAWLKGAFLKRGYDDKKPEAWREAAKAMKALIEKLNQGQARLALEINRAQAGTASGGPAFVHHVDLQGTLALHWSSDARQGWDNELHPVAQGFAHLADRIHQHVQGVLKKHGVRAPGSR